MNKTDIKNLTYSHYLNLEPLLSLQTPYTDDIENEESLFIIVHQSQELFFKQVILELYRLNTALFDNVPLIAYTIIQRIIAIFDSLTRQHALLAQIAMANFFQIRSILDKASGIQSFQFRKILFILGIKNEKDLSIFKNTKRYYDDLLHLMNQPNTLDGIYNFFYANKACNKDIIKFKTDIVQLYLNNKDTQLLIDALIELDVAVQNWRYGHLKLVEKMIGNKHGTGNTTGAKYLSSGVHKAAFPFLWQMRTDIHDYLANITNTET